MVSMQDIATQAGVSRVPFSRVLSNNPSVKAEDRQKVLIGKRNWIMSRISFAQSLAGNRTNSIGLLLGFRKRLPFFQKFYFEGGFPKGGKKIQGRFYWRGNF